MSDVLFEWKKCDLWQQKIKVCVGYCVLYCQSVVGATSCHASFERNITQMRLWIETIRKGCEPWKRIKRKSVRQRNSRESKANACAPIEITMIKIVIRASWVMFCLNEEVWLVATKNQSLNLCFCLLSVLPKLSIPCILTNHHSRNDSVCIKTIRKRMWARKTVRELNGEKSRAKGWAQMGIKIIIPSEHQLRNERLRVTERRASRRTCLSLSPTWSRVLMEGESPPCTQKTRSSISADKLR